jgi:hypothetical protein
MVISIWVLPHQVGNRFSQKVRDRLVEVARKKLEIQDHRLVEPPRLPKKPLTSGASML